MKRTIATIAALVLSTTSVQAQDTREAVNAEITAMFGGVPSFMNQVADAAVVGLWRQTKELGFSDSTALDPKTKALISLAVGAQIPCQYCVWLDTNAARMFGANDQEIAEAVAIAGHTRNMSAIFYGLQTDFDVLKAELGGP
jgi:AhpD family alkylhydroperoxidase